MCLPPVGWQGIANAREAVGASILLLTIRNGIEVSSITKHFERFSFAVLGIKDSYAGKPLGPIPVEKQGDFFWIFFTTLGLAGLMLVRPLKSDRLTKE